MKIKIAIVGYGNVGKSIEKQAYNSNEFKTLGIFTRREGVTSPLGTPVFKQSALLDARFKDEIDVAMLAVGSAFDLAETAERIAANYSTVDSFDTHAKMGEYISSLDDICKKSGTLAFVGCGWDPGIFSLERALLSVVVQGSIPQTFWGKGVSQGHSEAIRRIKGVKHAIQYTIPIESALKEAREGRTDFAPREKHRRECFVVPDYSAYFDKSAEDVSQDEKASLQAGIREQIVTMPNYFADYDTTVHFVSEEEFLQHHQAAYHGGEVIACSNAGAKSRAAFSVSLESNPDFTAGIMLAYARANFRMQKEGERGAKTVLDVPVRYLLDGDGLKFV